MDRAPRAQDGEVQTDAVSLLEDQGIIADLMDDEAQSDDLSSESAPQVMLLDISAMSDSAVAACARRCSRLQVPVIALVPRDRVAALDLAPGIDDFVVQPVDPNELVTRARQVLRRNITVEGEEVIRVGELAINESTYEVSVRGRRVNLRFKEYELLKLLATNPGRVYSREALLSRIWGYDYFGGTRTVDVHIRRLRSKIEDADHPFIETIWNVGYRFRDAS